MSTRTEELRSSGAEVRGSSDEGGAPFIKWPEEYAFVEGRVVDVWDTVHGKAVTLEVTNSSKNLNIDSESVNVGLTHKMLQDAITGRDKGGEFHVSFDGWGKSQSTGNKYRKFTVLCIQPPAAPVETRTDDKPFDPDDELPF